MHIVILHHGQEVSPERARELAAAMGVTPFDARQRLVGGGPAVVAGFSAPQPARDLLDRLHQGGFPGFLLDVDEARGHGESWVVKRFAFGETALSVEESGSGSDTIDYQEIQLLLPVFRHSGQTETHTVTERRFSLGRTLLAGGVPMTKKVRSHETLSTEERERVLVLVASGRPRLICSQNLMDFAGRGAHMKPTRDLNFSFFIEELRRRCKQARYDERLLRRAGQIHLLGPWLDPESHLDLAVEILVRDFAPAA
jgi:hypothetical protein